MANYIAQEEERKAKNRYAQYKQEVQKPRGLDMNKLKELDKTRDQRVSNEYNKRMNGTSNLPENMQNAQNNYMKLNDQAKGLAYAYGKARLDGSDADTNPTVNRLEKQIAQKSGLSGNDLRKQLNDARDLAKYKKKNANGYGFTSADKYDNALAKIGTLSPEEQAALADYSRAYSAKNLSLIHI